MLIVTILLGFAMMTLGVALLFLGEVPFVAGKRIPAIRSRLIGGVLVGFLPAAWLIRAITNALFPDVVEGPVITALTFSLCGCLVIAILFRVMVPRREPREPRKPVEVVGGPAKPNPFGDTATEPEIPAPPPPGKKPRKASAGDGNPFDFG